VCYLQAASTFVLVRTYPSNGFQILESEMPHPHENWVALLARTETVVVPRVPQEVIDEMLDYPVADSDLITLRLCSLVSKVHLIEPIRTPPGVGPTPDPTAR